MALRCSRFDLVFTRRTNPMQWVIVIAAFLASAVEFVEAFTLVLVAGITTNWRSAILGALGAAAVLAVIVATLGEARARREPAKTGLDTFGVLLSFKSVLLEGLEVAFIVISFGGGGTGGIGNAALGALGAGVLVIAVGALVQAPLKRIPENSLKFVVGIMLTTFGTFWGGESFGITWPFADLFLLILAALYLVVSGLLITGIRLRLPRLVKARATSPATTLVPEKGVQQ